MNPSDSRSDIHSALVTEMVEIFSAEGFIVEGALFEAQLGSPLPVKNTKYGDMEDKIPDVLAYDPSEKRSVIGMVCRGDGDLSSEETLIKLNVFLNCPVHPKEKPARLFIIVPASKVVEAIEVITRYLHPEYWASLQIISSKRIR